jgi:hypothetical protein
MWRSGCRSYISVSASCVWRCLSGSTVAPFPHPAHRTGQADYRPKVHRRGDSQADWPRRLWRNGHISEYARRFGDALLNAKASHWTPIIVWVSAVSHRCSVANTNPPASNARPVGMHVRRGGLPGWRSIGRSVTQKKMFPAQSATSCQELSSVSNSSVGILATLAMKAAFPALKAKAHDDSGSS